MNYLDPDFDLPVLLRLVALEGIFVSGTPATSYVWTRDRSWWMSQLCEWKPDPSPWPRVEFKDVPEPYQQILLAELNDIVADMWGAQS